MSWALVTPCSQPQQPLAVGNQSSLLPSPALTWHVSGTGTSPSVLATGLHLVLSQPPGPGPIVTSFQGREAGHSGHIARRRPRQSHRGATLPLPQRGSDQRLLQPSLCLWDRGTCSGRHLGNWRAHSNHLHGPPGLRGRANCLGEAVLGTLGCSSSPEASRWERVGHGRSVGYYGTHLCPDATEAKPEPSTPSLGRAAERALTDLTGTLSTKGRDAHRRAPWGGWG